MIKKNNNIILKISILSIIAIAIVVIVIWISKDDYVPQKLGNSISAALNNRRQEFW